MEQYTETGQGGGAAMSIKKEYAGPALPTMEIPDQWSTTLMTLDEMVDITIRLLPQIVQDYNTKKQVTLEAKFGGKRRSKRKRDADESNDNPKQATRMLALLTSKKRGDTTFVRCNETEPPDSVLEGTTLSALTSVFANHTTSSKKKVSACHPKLVLSTFTHEAKQLYWKRTHIPLCSNKMDCAARKYFGAAPFGPLHIYLYPEEQMRYDMVQHLPKLQECWKSSGPRFCLICYRRMAHRIKLEADVKNLNKKFPQREATILLPFTNQVDVPDGYRMEAMAVTPNDKCMVGAPYICTAT